MRTIRITVSLMLGLAALAACMSPAPVDSRVLATSVASTLAAIVPAPTLVPSGTPTLAAPSTDGLVTGKVCYPSSGIPPMTAYFQQVPGGVLVTVPIAQDQSSYSANLPMGTYTGYAWRPGFAIGGSYSKAVPCGLGASCTDHGLLEFGVTAGLTTANIDLCDWYGQPGDVPLPLGVTPVVTPTASGTPTDATPAAAPTDSTPGAIEGSLSYPGSVPKLVIVAFNLDTSYWWWLGTGDGWASYEIADIPPGRYQVVAYAPNGQEAAYASGTSAKTVTVNPGAATTGINLSDWRPAGTFQARPGEINYP